MPNAVIAGYVRSPFTLAKKGALAGVRPDDMAAEVIRALVARTKINPEHIEDIKLGCAFPEGEQGLNIGRLVAFIAGLPISVAGVTINRFCGSSMQSIHDAVGAIMAGAGEIFVCGGVESMTRVPMTGFNPLPNPALYEKYPEAYESMGITAENVANLYKQKRKDLEEFALLSQQKAASAQKSGKLKDEIVPVAGVTEDGCIRADTTLAGLAELKPAFDKKGLITAGVASPLTDGASAVLVVSEDYADKHGLPKLARIKSMAVSSCAPELMGLGPIGASGKALQRANLTIRDIDIVELNEAFASQAMAVIQELGIDEKTLNLDGGAIALGHPLGASGARITGKAASLLVRENKKYALATMCIGGGQGIATILERI